MKKLLLLLALVLSLSTVASAQNEITEERFKVADSLIWHKYDARIAELRALLTQFPDKNDSLYKCMECAYDLTQEENKALALKYFATPGGLDRVYRLRGAIGKDTIAQMLRQLPPDLKNARHVLPLKKHIAWKQIAPGDKTTDFKASFADGRKFKLSALRGKKVLLIYGGIGCMGENGRDFLDKLYADTSRDQLEIVMFQDADNVEELLETQKFGKMSYLLVSDFAGDTNLFKAKYGCQAMPTCYLINEQGVVEDRFSGLHQSVIGLFVTR